MPIRALWVSQQWRKQIGLIFTSSATLIWLQSRSKVLRNDSDSPTQWPSYRPSIDERRPHAKSTRNSSTQITEQRQHAQSTKADQTNEAIFEHDDDAAWASFSTRFTDATSSLAEIHWASIGDKVADMIVPEWAKSVPGYVAKLQSELEMGPGSLADEIWQDAQDPYIHPEIMSPARVRIGKSLCDEELAFVQRRKKHITRALAKYLKIPESEINPQDVPTIALCGSGGGLRALVAGASSALCAQESGLFDCVTYTAGVSGSCWLQTLYNSSLGGHKFGKVIEHLKKRIGIHIAYPPAFLELMTRAPTNKYLLSGTVEKLKSDSKAGFGLVDVYGLLVAARLMVPRDELSIDDQDLKLSDQRKYLSQGLNPMPIYTAVRHEIPIEKIKKDDGMSKEDINALKEKVKKEAWFQWFEFTPYELSCEELEAAIPSWSIGRHFDKGKAEPQVNGLGFPELRVPFLMGMWGSAFCASLAHYYKEVRPIVRNIAGLGGLNDLIEGQNDDLIKLHPIDPGQIPNYALGLKGALPFTCPDSIFKARYLELMDAGMSNNLPLYPLLRQGRDVDIIVCFDASADIKQENWLSVADGYAKQRGIKGWPIGAGWPKAKTSSDDTKMELDAADAATAQQAAGKIAEIRDEHHDGGITSDKATDAASRGDSSSQNEPDLGFCNVWVGTTVERISGNEPPHSKRIDPDKDWMLMEPNSGLTVIYFPFVANPKVEGVDPNTSAFMSTWNFIYTPPQIDQVVALARANFEAGEEQTKRTVRAVYDRKKAGRLQLEARGRSKKWNREVRRGGDQFL